MGMKVLLLNSPWVNNDKEYGIKSGTRWACIRKKDRSMPYFPFPYFMAWCKTVLKKSGIDAYIKDAIAEEMSERTCLDYIKGIAPDIVVIEAFTPSIYADLDFAGKVKKETGARIAFCGAHVSALPEDILQNAQVDFALIGEYTYALRGLCSDIAQGKNDFEIPGLAFRVGGAVKINPVSNDAVEDINEIVFPECDGLPMERYTEPLSKNFPNAKIVTTKGCPYNCIFCVEPLMYGRKYRQRAIENVIKEIRMLQEKYDIKEIYFDDAIVTIPRAKEIASEIIKNNIDIVWTCWVDWKISFEDMLLLKKSGCVALKFGIETANEVIMKTIGKAVVLDTIKNALNNCRKSGIMSHGSFMFGLPGETRTSLQDTLDLAFSIGVDSCQFSIATPLPGTPFYDMAKKQKWLTASDWTEFDSLSKSVVEYPGCSRKDIENAIDKARRRKIGQFLKNPLNILRYLLKFYKLYGISCFCRELLRKSLFVLKINSEKARKSD